VSVSVISALALFLALDWAARVLIRAVFFLLARPFPPVRGANSHSHPHSHSHSHSLLDKEPSRGRTEGYAVGEKLSLDLIRAGVDCLASRVPLIPRPFESERGSRGELFDLHDRRDRLTGQPSPPLGSIRRADDQIEGDLTASEIECEPAVERVRDHEGEFDRDTATSGRGRVHPKLHRIAGSSAARAHRWSGSRAVRSTGNARRGTEAENEDRSTGPA
jgi:hypothetical protein